MAKFKKCSICSKPCIPTGNFDSGYGIDENDKINCYSCCANQDYKRMLNTGKTMLYYGLIDQNNPHGFKLSNWPGSLVFKVAFYSRGNHNIAGNRTDFYFKIPYDPFVWWGVTYGDWTQITHCKRTKRTEF